MTLRCRIRGCRETFESVETHIALARSDARAKGWGTCAQVHRSSGRFRYCDLCPRHINHEVKMATQTIAKEQA